jgi:hypothetical protein
MEELRCEIGAVGPRDRVKLRVDLDLLELLEVAERLEDGTPQLT